MKELYARYLSGTITTEEKEKLFDYLTQHDEVREEFAELHNLIALAGIKESEEDKKRIPSKLNQLSRTIRNRRARKIHFLWLKYAVVIGLLISSWTFSEFYTYQKYKEDCTIIEVPKGQRVFMTLPDGTEVWLSARTELKIPSQFNKKNRTVELDGEGFFIVKNRENYPFIVNTKDFHIRVLGTRFNVFSYDENPRFETDLVEGRLHIYPREDIDNGIYLNSKEKVFLEDGKLVKSHSSFRNEEYLKSGIFSFRGKTFEEILEYLSLWYDVDFDVKDPELLNKRIAGKFRQSDEVENILKVLSRGVHEFKYTILSEDKIEIDKIK